MWRNMAEREVWVMSVLVNINSTDRKTKKWDKAKGIINWIATKGVDVAMTVIPLLMKLGE